MEEETLDKVRENAGRDMIKFVKKRKGNISPEEMVFKMMDIFICNYTKEKEKLNKEEEFILTDLRSEI